MRFPCELSCLPRGISGHDHFFATFDKFRAAESLRPGEYVDEIASRAAAQNEQYLELMHTPSFPRTAAIAHEIGWKDDLETLRQEILKRGRPGRYRRREGGTR